MRFSLRSQLVVMLVFISSWTGSLRAADDVLNPEAVKEVKRATVYIKVVGPLGKASGSGFVISVDKDSALIATNHHVISPPGPEPKSQPTPSELFRAFKQVTVTTVFEAGNANEYELKATILAADVENDLAILKVTGLKDPPNPIPIDPPPQLIETMAVYSFGYPFGQALATGKGAPAVTVGKASISSLRKKDNGELELVQIDGVLNPGNSGGPIVDAKGRLVGVAVAIIRDGQGIGLAVPGIELVRAIKGRIGHISMNTARGADGKWLARVEINLVDPLQSIKAVQLHSATIPAGGAKPSQTEPLSSLAAAKKVTLRVTNGIASGEVPLDAIGGELYLQATPEGGTGLVTTIRRFPILLGRQAGAINPRDDQPNPGSEVGDPGEAPPAGWKDYAPPDRSYSIWIPEKAMRQRQQERTSTTNGLRLKFNILTIDMPGGLSYLVEEIILPTSIVNGKRADIETVLKQIATQEIGGRLLSEQSVKVGRLNGKEYEFEASGRSIRIRTFLAGNRLIVLRTIGSKQQLEGAAGKLFLASISVPARPGVGINPNPPAAPSRPGTPSNPNGDQGNANRVAGGRKTPIQGGGNDPEFFDESPKPGVLVGIEVGLGKFGNNSVIHAARPIFRTGETDSPGQWHGPIAGKEVQSAIAKPGYALGKITVKNGLTVDGISVTFMRVTNSGLDSSDSYESPWLGGPGGSSMATLGDGTIVTGLIGRNRNDSLTGLGLLYRDASETSAAVTTMGSPPAPTPPSSSAITPSNSPTPPNPLPLVPFTPPSSNPRREAPAPNLKPASSPAPNGDSQSTPFVQEKPEGPSSIFAVLSIVLLIAGSGTMVFGFIVLMKGGKSTTRNEFDDEDDDRPRRKLISSRDKQTTRRVR